MLDEFLLNRMQRAVRADSFNRRDVCALRAFHQHETGAHGSAVLNDHTTAAVSGRATILDAGETQLIAQDIHQFRFRCCGNLNGFAVHDEVVKLFGHFLLLEKCGDRHFSSREDARRRHSQRVNGDR